LWCFASLRALHSCPTRRSSDLTLSIGTDALHVIARVPHMNIAVTRGRSLPVVTLLPQSFDIETLEDTQLRVTVPPELRATLGLRSEEHTSELQSRENLVCRLLL